MILVLVVIIGPIIGAVWNLERRQAHNSRVRDQQLCAVVDQLPTNPIVSQLQNALDCKRFQ